MDYIDRIHNCKNLDELFTEWKNTEPQGIINHRDNTFITDGIVDPESWGQEGNKRILFVLKEAYGDWKDDTLTSWLHMHHPKLSKRQIIRLYLK